MGKSYKQFHRINPYAKLYWMDTEKGCKYNLFISSSVAKHVFFLVFGGNHFVLQNLLMKEVLLNYRSLLKLCTMLHGTESQTSIIVTTVRTLKKTVFFHPTTIVEVLSILVSAFLSE
jgi:hypothetical protein